MTLISKTAGALSLFSSIKDIHNTALMYSNRSTMKASADTFLANSLSTQRTNRLSLKDTKRKQWLAKNNYLLFASDPLASVRGYCEGVIQGVCYYMPQLVLSTLAIGIGNKHKVIANACAVALGIVEGLDVLTNTFSIGQKNDYLKL